LVEQVQVLNRGVVEAKSCPDATLAGSAKNLAQRPFAEARRIGKTDARTEIIVLGWSKRLGNAGVTREYQSFGRKWKDRGLLSGNEGLKFPLRIVPRHAHFPAQAEIQRKVGFSLPGFCALWSTPRPSDLASELKWVTESTANTCRRSR